MAQDHIFINGKKILVSDWSFTVFQLCDSLDIKIPRFCYHERLSIAGNCRMCMVEVTSSLKPLVSCATPLSKGMSILTDSALVKKAREGVLEFLLINHPLDCPICDQGGECDLQDQSIVYGADKGRFLETKRSVEDKDFGPIVKTVMTRCIHCTRCVRFFEEIAGNPVIGTMGRGKETEISTYLNNSILSSNISGNVIDLCPVGALTSKPHAFLYRSWELVGAESIDVLDSFCSNIRVDLKGSEIVRILPRRNDLINQDWISNQTRYSFDGLKNQRFSYPMHYTRESGCFKITNWDSFYSSFSFYYLNTIQSGLSGCLDLGSGLDLYSIYLYNLFGKTLSTLSNSNLSSVDFRQNYVCSSFSYIDSSDIFMISGFDVSRDFPLLNTRFLQKYNSKRGGLFLYHGLTSKFNFDVNHIGISYNSLFSFSRGKHLSSSLFSIKKQIQFYSTCSFASRIIDQSFNPVNVNLLKRDTTSVALSELGFNSISRIDSSFYYGLNVSFIPSLSTSSFCVLHSTHSKMSLSSLKSYNNVSSCWYLPSFSPFESELPYINLLGMIQWTRKCSSSFGESLTYEDVLRRLINLNTPHTSNLCLQGFSDKLPSLFFSNCSSGEFSFFSNTNSFFFEDSNVSNVPFLDFSTVKLN